MDSEKNSWLIEEMRRYYAIGGGAYLTMKQNDKDKIIPAVKKTHCTLYSDTKKCAKQNSEEC